MDNYKKYQFLKKNPYLGSKMKFKNHINRRIVTIKELCKTQIL